jgi:molecular chaperone GrpE
MTDIKSKKSKNTSTSKSKKKKISAPKNNKKILELEKKNSEQKDIIDDLNNKLLRSLAENENLRRKSEEDVKNAHKYAISNFANDLTVVIENFYLSTDHLPEEEVKKSDKVKNFVDGIIMTKKELVKIFEKNNINRIYPLKEKFDHNLHQALSQVESDEEAGIIIQVIQSGYQIGDRLIRPALVNVSKGKKDQ